MKLTDDSYVTIKDYLEIAKENHENIVYYTSDKALQAQYISLMTEQSIKVAYFDKPFEVQFLSMLEQYMENVKFVRVDSDVSSALKENTNAAANEQLEDLFKKASGTEAIKIKFEALKTTKIPAILTLSEEARRFEEMMRMYSGNDNSANLPHDETLVVNSSCPLIDKLSALVSENADKASRMASYIFKLAVISQRKLSAEEMSSFLEDSFALLEEI